MQLDVANVLYFQLYKYSLIKSSISALCNFLSITSACLEAYRKSKKALLTFREKVDYNLYFIYFYIVYCLCLPSRMILYRASLYPASCSLISVLNQIDFRKIRLVFVGIEV